MPKLDYETTVKQEIAHLKKIYPSPEDIPSCLSLMDTFLSCHILNHQMRSLYRYGQMSECAQKGEDFKFCMSNKSLHEQEKYEAWIHRRAEWWAKRRLAKSSEDVWNIRSEPLQNYPPPLTEMSTKLNGPTLT
ncbi:hypothetical protein BDW22DRAFT_1326732 [Trametopsis cervina]|nr:hypothetical protein BDW22DRAFT_1326732 [Trametopsis cervina]